jgi:DNA replication protein DnaC
MIRLGLILKHKRPLTPQDFERAHIEGRLHDASLGAIPDSADYKKRLYWFIGNLEKNLKEGVGLTISGSHGGGKSASASIISQEVMAWGGSVLFLEEAVLIDKVIKREEFPYSEGLSYSERAEEVDLLVIDDLGLSAQSENLHIIEALVKYRLRKGISTIIVTNLKKEEFVKRYRTIADAVREACLPMVCEGVAWRDVKEKELKDRYLKESQKIALPEVSS